jgi:hypothetical protein
MLRAQGDTSDQDEASIKNGNELLPSTIQFKI